MFKQFKVKIALWLCPQLQRNKYELRLKGWLSSITLSANETIDVFELDNQLNFKIVKKELRLKSARL